MNNSKKMQYKLVVEEKACEPKVRFYDEILTAELGYNACMFVNSLVTSVKLYDKSGRLLKVRDREV